MRDLPSLCTARIQQGIPLVYCLIVATRGSTPQKAGAAMLVFLDGSQVGTLGGGRAEAEVKQRALGILQQSHPKVEVQKFILEEDEAWDDGIMCGGQMTVILDPRNTPEALAYYEKLNQIHEMEQGGTEIIVLAENTAQIPVGSRYLLDHNQSVLAQFDGSKLPLEVLRRVISPTQRPRPSVWESWAFLPILPRITLLIVGGGHVGEAVARLAHEVDFDIWVLDDREKFANSERFPQAQKHFVGAIGQTLQHLQSSIHPGIYCLIVTRGHNHDEEALRHLVQTSAGYVGMIGSQRKVKRIFDSLRSHGVAEVALAQVHAPLGLPIGSQTVPEIAISIVAELIACRNLGSSRQSVSNG